MRGRDFLKAGGAEELWPEGVRVVKGGEASSTILGNRNQTTKIAE